MFVVVVVFVFVFVFVVVFVVEFWFVFVGQSSSKQWMCFLDGCTCSDRRYLTLRTNIKIRTNDVLITLWQSSSGFSKKVSVYTVLFIFFLCCIFPNSAELHSLVLVHRWLFRTYH